MCFSAKSGMWTLRIQPPPVIPSTRGLKMKPGVSDHGSLGNILYDFTLCEWKHELDSKILTHVCKSSGPSVGKGQDPTGWSVFSFWAGPTTQAAFLLFSCPHSCPLGIVFPCGTGSRAEHSPADPLLFSLHLIPRNLIHWPLSVLKFLLLIPSCLCICRLPFLECLLQPLIFRIGLSHLPWLLLPSSQEAGASSPVLMGIWLCLFYILHYSTCHMAYDYLFTYVSSPMRLSQVWHWHLNMFICKLEFQVKTCRKKVGPWQQRKVKSRNVDLGTIFHRRGS